MAAYAAATSLINLLEQVLSYHDRNAVLLDDQLKQLASIQEKVDSFQNYLESGHHTAHTKGAADLEGRIADTCYEAEDVIESYIVGYIHSKRLAEEKEGQNPVNPNTKEIHHESRGVFKKLKKTPNIFSQGLEKVMNEMDSIEKEAKLIKENGAHEDQQGLSFTSEDSIRPPPTPSDIFVGRKDLCISVIEKIVGGKPNRQVIPITGMGGIGKTMLARKVYDSPNAVGHFDTRGWVTISQVYDVRKLMSCLLHDLKASIPGNEENLADHELGETLYKQLFGRRYLVVLDDIWRIDAWENIKRFLPNNSNGSRVMVTSRLRVVTNCMDSSNHFEMNLLDENESWKLFHEKVFGKQICPQEFMEVGKRIARNCKGLPLSLIVIGGLLAKSKMILRQWEEISANTSAIVNSEDDESHLVPLALSYKHLPMHLKPCFLYMGVFAEDEEIHVSRLINLLVAEGFLKVKQGSSMEEVAHSYLTDLTDRNLILVSRRKHGIVKGFKIHDLLRDLCLREAKKCGFLSYIREQDPITLGVISRQRRIGSRAMNLRVSEGQPENIVENDQNFQVCQSLKSASFLRSFVEYSPGFYPAKKMVDLEKAASEVSLPMLKLEYFKLLRVLDVTEEYSLEVIFQSVNSRYISYQASWISYTLSSLNLLWNIQTLVMGNKVMTGMFIVPSAMWEMPQLRQVWIYNFVMPEPPSQKGGCDIVVQKNLQTLLQIRDFRLTEEILNGRPNIKKLTIYQGWEKTELRFSDYLLNNLVRLDNLQSLHCWFGEQYSRAEVLMGIKFPKSLKKLTLVRSPFEWDDMTTTIGDLPQLEVLKLNFACHGEEWKPLDGQFRKLKRLKIVNQGPRRWNADSRHFPVLQQLYLDSTWGMTEIPSGIGEIDTLLSIHVIDGCASLVASARAISEEKKWLGDEDFKLIVKSYTNFYKEDN